MYEEIEKYLEKSVDWKDLPFELQTYLGNSRQRYEGFMIDYNFSNQIEWNHSLACKEIKNEEKYYKMMIESSKNNLLIYPYHLSDILIKTFQITPYKYYLSILKDLLDTEKSYDTLPNFTAADFLQILGIGRNEFITLIQNAKSSKWFFNKNMKNTFLPKQPNSWNALAPWWHVKTGFITYDDIAKCDSREKEVVDGIIQMNKIDSFALAGAFPKETLLKLLSRDLIYFQIPIEDDEMLTIPTLKNFVMNRVQGDFMESLMYELMTVMDDKSSINELVNILPKSKSSIKNALSLFCRLGMASKNGALMSIPAGIHSSWQDSISEITMEQTQPMDDPPNSDVCRNSKRIAMIYDAEAAAFLMMGEVSSEKLKQHAVTMFEVGKLRDEQLDSFLEGSEIIFSTNCEISDDIQRMQSFISGLRHSIISLRGNRHVFGDEDEAFTGIDLLSISNLNSLNKKTLLHLLKQRYRILITLSSELKDHKTLCCRSPPHFGPPIPDVKTVLFPLFLYHELKSGPKCLLLPRGYCIRKLPIFLKKYQFVLVYTNNKTPIIHRLNVFMLLLREILPHTPVLLIGIPNKVSDCTKRLPIYNLSLPLSKDDPINKADSDNDAPILTPVQQMTKKLIPLFGLNNSLGHITFIPVSAENSENETNTQKQPSSCLSEDSPSSGKHYTSDLRNEEKLDPKLLSSSGEIPGYYAPLNVAYGLYPVYYQQTISSIKQLNEQCLFANDSLEKYTEITQDMVLRYLNFLESIEAINNVFGGSFSDASPIDQHCSKDTHIFLPTKPIFFDGANFHDWTDTAWNPVDENK